MRKIALAGNPNSGKTSLFNALTGSKYKVANYPGVTVEKKISEISFNGSEEIFQIFDLPGIYSLSSTSIDEKIATSTLLEINADKPDLIVCVLDSTNLERNLYLLSQLLDTTIPIVVALNMIDLAKSRGITIYEELLSKNIKARVIPIIAKTHFGIESLKIEILKQINNPSKSNSFTWCKNSKLIELATEVGENIKSGSNESIKALFGFGYLAESLNNESPSSKGFVALTKLKENIIELGKDPLTFEASERYKWASEIVSSVIKVKPILKHSFSKKLDYILTHKFWGTLIFILIMGMMFQAIFSWAKIPMEFISDSITTFGNFIGDFLPEGILKSLLVNGVISGVGSVLVFIPQIAVLFFFLGLLEDSGYLSRAAFLMDGIMRKFGLQGRSFIPLLSSFACAIPGIMSTRTIPSWSDRLATILVAPLMSCSARLPVYTVIIAAFIPETYLWGVISLQGLTMLSLYLLGIIAAAGVSWILKMTILSREPAYFIMELPSIRVPSVKLVLREVFDRIKLFLKSAGSVILACSIILWFLSSYPRQIDGSQPLLEHSFAGYMGQFIEPVIRPIGFSWEMGIGIIASFAAREVFVSSLATIYNLSNNSDDATSLITLLKEKHVSGEITLASAMSLLVFYVFACQCMSTIAVCKRETGSWNWVIFMFTYMTALAYLSSWVVYNIFLRISI